MNFARLAVVIPLYILIVGTLDQSGISRQILSVPFPTIALWGIEVGATVIGLAGAWLFQRRGGILERSQTLFNAVVTHALFGLVISGGFGIFSLASGEYPYLPGLIIVPLAFGLSELGYILIMRAWSARKERQQEFYDDLK